MRASVATALGASVVLIFSASSVASHCVMYSTSVSSLESVVIELPRRFFGEGQDWLVIDLCQPECIVSAFYYAQTNGIPGLQRSDQTVDDTCHGLIAGDQFVY